jgi:hypothetical protein
MESKTLATSGPKSPETFFEAMTYWSNPGQAKKVKTLARASHNRLPP